MPHRFAWPSLLCLSLLVGTAQGEPAGDGRTGAATAGGQARKDRHGDPLPADAVARLGTLRLRHGGKIFALAFTPDNKSIASAGEGDIVLWDLTTGAERRRLSGHSGLTC